MKKDLHTSKRERWGLTRAIFPQWFQAHFTIWRHVIQILSQFKCIIPSPLQITYLLFKALHLHSSASWIKLSQTAIHLISEILHLKQYLNSNDIKSCLLIYAGTNSVTGAHLTLSKTMIMYHILWNKLPFNFFKGYNPLTLNFTTPYHFAFSSLTYLCSLHKCFFTSEIKWILSIGESSLIFRSPPPPNN